jgi:hypothetical protein
LPIKIPATFSSPNKAVNQCRVTLEGKGVPAKYTSEDSTPLIIEVKEGANWHRFELE